MFSLKVKGYGFYVKLKAKGKTAVIWAMGLLVIGGGAAAYALSSYDSNNLHTD